MSNLAHLFAEITEGLNRSDAAPISGFPEYTKLDPEQQALESKCFSGISGISGKNDGTPPRSEEKAAQACVQARASARARVPLKNHPETPETPEMLAAARGYLSGSLFLNPEKERKTGKAAPLPAPSPPGLDPDAAAAFDERAAILEYDAGLSRAEAERQARQELRFGGSALPGQDGLALWRAGLACLDPQSPPCPDYRAEEWPRVLARALAFLDTFGEQAEALGWTACRLFGVHSEIGVVRVDHCGGLVLPIGGPVRAITATEIRFSHLVHRTKPGRPEGLPIWEFGR